MLLYAAATFYQCKFYRKKEEKELLKRHPKKGQKKHLQNRHLWSLPNQQNMPLLEESKKLPLLQF